MYKCENPYCDNNVQVYGNKWCPVCHDVVNQKGETQALFNKWIGKVHEILQDVHGWSVLMLPFETSHDKDVEMYLADKTPESAAEFYHHHIQATWPGKK